MFALCAAIGAASAWMYFGVERSLRELRAQGLPALLDAKTKSLEVFIAERRADGERWARDPQVAALTATSRAAPAAAISASIAAAPKGSSGARCSRRSCATRTWPR